MDDRTTESDSGFGAAQLPDPPPATDAGPPPRAASPRGRRTIVILGGVVAAVVLIAGVGLAAVMYALRGSAERLTATTPANVDFFATVNLDPSAGQKLNLERMIRRFPALGGSEHIGERLDTTLDGVLAGAGLNDGDIRAWLGSEVAITGRLSEAGSSFGVLIDSADDGAAQGTLEKLRTEGIQGQPYSWSSVRRDGTTIWVGRPQPGGAPLVLAVIDGTVVVANALPLAIDVMSAASGAVPSLQESSSYQRAIASLPEERLALVYADIGSIAATLGSTFSPGVASPLAGGAVPGMPDAGAVDAVALSIAAQPDGLRLDMATTLDPTRTTPQMRSALAGDRNTANETLSWVPSDAYGVITMSGLREQIEAALAESGAETSLPLEQLGLTGPDGVIAHLTGQASIEVSPGAGRSPTGALVVGTDDADGMRAFLDAMSAQAVGVIEASGGPTASWRSTTYRGVDIRSLTSRHGEPSSLSPSYAVVDGAGILGASPEAIRAAIDAHSGTSIATEPTFRAAVEAIDGFGGDIVYVDVDGIGPAIREALPPEERASFDLQVAPNLEPIDAFVAGTKPTSSGFSTRMMLLIR